MNAFWIWIVAAIVWINPAVQILREHELCPFVCRIDANGIRGAWYETNLPTFGLSHTLWVSEQQKELMGARP